MTLTSLKSIGKKRSSLSKTRVTSAKFRAGREEEPAKITSGIVPPRKFFADCSPNTQRIASVILLFPLPLGPTTAVNP